MENKARSNILAKLGSSEANHETPPERTKLNFVERTECLVSLFTQKLETVHSSVEQVDSDEEIVESIIKFIRAFDGVLDIQPCPAVNVERLSNDSGLSFSSNEDLTSCQTILTQAVCGVAETGTLLMPSSFKRPSLANFLPDNCIILIHEKDILPYLEDALAFVQASEDEMPRALNLISGPSKTADIEQTLVYGAHGPIRLHIIVLCS